MTNLPGLPAHLWPRYEDWGTAETFIEQFKNALSHDGKSFTTVGWVEVNDPARVAKMRQLRRESSPPETSRRVYELRVVEIPLPEG